MWIKNKQKSNSSFKTIYVHKIINILQCSIEDLKKVQYTFSTIPTYKELETYINDVIDKISPFPLPILYKDKKIYIHDFSYKKQIQIIGSCIVHMKHDATFDYTLLQPKQYLYTFFYPIPKRNTRIVYFIIITVLLIGIYRNVQWHYKSYLFIILFVIMLNMYSIL